MFAVEGVLKSDNIQFTKVALPREDLLDGRGFSAGSYIAGIKKLYNSIVSGTLNATTVNMSGPGQAMKPFIQS